MSATDPDIVEPNAAAMIESLRAFGYDLATALADLADNSIFHKARNIRLHFHWAGEQSAIAIGDDGDGMDEPTLTEAMRIGSRNPREERDPADLGRFGLGLKTASYSQCRRVTVFTRRNGGEPLVRCWDHDHVAKTNKWQLLRSASKTAAMLARRLLAQSKHGTVVVWESLDRITSGALTESDKDEDAFLRQAEQAGRHFGVVFHRLIKGQECLKFFLNDRPIEPWDPFLISEPATQRLAADTLRFKGAIIQVQPFVLPHLSKVDKETHAAAAGLRGWNAHQGFYIYRNRRLLVPGDWLGIKGWRQEEHYKLARIQVDLPNSLDDEWAIDVTKSRARPPEKLRSDLTRIGELTRSMAKRVYSFRGAKLLPAEGAEKVFMWTQNAKHSQVSYRLNRDHPLLTAVREACADKSKFSSLLRMIEETIPVPLITITDRERPDQTVAPFELAKDGEIMDVMRQVLKALEADGHSRSDALQRLACFEPFPRYPHLLKTIEEEK